MHDLPENLVWGVLAVFQPRRGRLNGWRGAISQRLKVACSGGTLNEEFIWGATRVGIARLWPVGPANSGP
eukprot:4733770-Pyramimonas_sp.AAC.1